MTDFDILQLTNELKCFSFCIKNEIDVQDVKPAIVKLYDYYQPELEVTEEYVIPSGCDAPNLPELLTSTLADELLSTFHGLDEPSSTQDIATLASESYTNVTNVHKNSTVIPEVLQILDGSQQNKSHAEDISDDDISTINAFQTLENNSPVDYVNLTHGSHFPVLSEGNLSVSILPPAQDFSELNDEAGVLDCPICMATLPENFIDIYCTSAFALIASIRSGNAKAVKILHDVSSYMQHPQMIQKLAEVKWDERCSCPQLTTGENTIIIIGSPVTLWSSEETKHCIHLTRQVYVISSSVITQPEVLMQTRRSCDGNP
ncbi:uncharacterized protein LOC118200881 [Stegodyphus dumicola]|uniref:uncharacterized protein LOC118200881 n=1 Tax=Stegodyphus dumicola TaxID=202533 RepID=UPI0015B274BD|nr:uncharacterized protein LOC118200881 [Stegodyphus dumicola]